MLLEVRHSNYSQKRTGANGGRRLREYRCGAETSAAVGCPGTRCQMLARLGGNPSSLTGAPGLIRQLCSHYTLTKTTLCCPPPSLDLANISICLLLQISISQACQMAASLFGLSSLPPLPLTVFLHHQSDAQLQKESTLVSSHISSRTPKKPRQQQQPNRPGSSQSSRRRMELSLVA